MMSFKEYSFQEHRQVYEIIDVVMKSFGYQYYLIGANARDIQLYKAGIKPTRGTADVDFAVMVPTISAYQNFMDSLLEKGFKKTRQTYRVFYEATNTVVDILPYGKLAQEYTINFDERAVEISVLGFEEVGEEKEEFEIADNFTIPTTPAHGLIILKLISWNDRKDRNKDLKDIRSLLEAGWELYKDEIYKQDSNHFDLLEDDDFDVHNAAARIIGRKIKPILEKCQPLKTTILGLLTTEVNDPGIMTIEMSGREETEKVISLLSHLLQGINDEM